MELDKSILDEAYKAAEAEDSNAGISEPAKVETDSPSTAAAPAVEDDKNNLDKAGNGVSIKDENGNGTEPDAVSNQRRDVNDGRRHLTRLDKAEFAAAKWKRRAKEMQAQRDNAAAELNKYKDLDPRNFRNEEDRADFLAWRASKRQQVNDYDETLGQMYAEHDREVYEDKISKCYNDEGAQKFNELDEHYNAPFEAFCNSVDPDNVILDYLRNSEYEPAMRHVIYMNGDLQQTLLGRNYNNRQIASAERLSILKNLERQVADFYKNAGKQKQSQSRPPVGNAANNQNGAAAAPKGAPENGPRFVLPSMRQAAPAAPAAAQSVQVPSQPARNPARRAPQVTGSLTRGNVGNGSIDPSVGADALYGRLFTAN